LTLKLRMSTEGPTSKIEAAATPVYEPALRTLFLQTVFLLWPD